MRTTLTIDEDVAVQLKRLRRARDAKLKELINEALRRGLREMSGAAQKRRPVHTRTFADALAHLEGDGFK
jgi:SpoVK/Ycf46/Vps4 family AAA+-type ATPase